ncbi:MAG: magnesium/cobalt transporter CorA [Betaproteobacteria bacterium]|nr:magnesium/cobalt transporter CorA [Betaproteobacteria bacterium]
MARLMKKRSAKAGLPPGSLVYVGDRREQDTRISVIDYDEQHVEERDIATIDECLQFKDTATVTWINVDEIGEPGLVAAFGRVLGFHPLMQEDILNTDQRAKVEDHGDHLYIVLKMLEWSKARDAMDSEQLSIVLGAHYVISFQERAGDFFDPLRERIRGSVGRIRRQRSDFLAYCLLDLVIDHYFMVLERLGDRIERVDDAVMTRPEPAVLREIHQLKRELLFMRKSVWPMKETIASLRHTDTMLIAKATQPFLRDLQDHIEQVIDGIEAYQDLLSDILATYLSTQSNRTNTIMKVLAVFSAVFMPLTFITGIFGMNFRTMPPLEGEWGFAGTLGVMFVMGVSMAAFFVLKRWL